MISTINIILITVCLLVLIILCFSLAGANRAFSTPEQIAQEDEEQWRAINGR